MEKFKELEKYRQKSDIIRKENGVVPYEGDEQKSRISSLFDEIMTKLNSVKIPKRRSHGWLRFWSVLVIVVIGLVAGGVYWFNQQSDADEQIRVRDKAWRELTGLSKTELPPALIKKTDGQHSFPIVFFNSFSCFKNQGNV